MKRTSWSVVSPSCAENVPPSGSAAAGGVPADHTAVRHVPHVMIPGPWSGPQIALDEAQFHHLSMVLKRGPDSPISYTDGGGTCGTGVLAGSRILRGEETRFEAPTPPIRIACPPPSDRTRARFLVEKLAELGVDELMWLQTRRTQGRPPSPAKSRAWAVAALEQSRGSRLMAITGAVRLQSLPSQALWVAERENEPPQRVVVGDIIVIGPEGGLDRDEVPAGVRKFGLGHRVLRVETAAIAAATLFLDRAGRLRSPHAAT